MSTGTVVDSCGAAYSNTNTAANMFPQGQSTTDAGGAATNNPALCHKPAACTAGDCTAL
tara:strand:- start:1634 stop:1810 length:177 start_codon:yes stop_codon:yes gene_type:complete